MESFRNGAISGRLWEFAVYVVSYTGPCAWKGPVLCCHHLEIIHLNTGPHISHFHWAPCCKFYSLLWSHVEEDS